MKTAHVDSFHWAIRLLVSLPTRLLKIFVHLLQVNFVVADNVVEVHHNFRLLDIVFNVLDYHGIPVFFGEQLSSPWQNGPLNLLTPVGLCGIARTNALPDTHLYNEFNHDTLLYDSWVGLKQNQFSQDFII